MWRATIARVTIVRAVALVARQFTLTNRDAPRRQLKQLALQHERRGRLGLWSSNSCRHWCGCEREPHQPADVLDVVAQEAPLTEQREFLCGRANDDPPFTERTRMQPA